MNIYYLVYGMSDSMNLHKFANNFLNLVVKVLELLATFAKQR